MRCVWMLLAGLVVLVGQPALAQREAPESAARARRGGASTTELSELPKTEWTLEQLDNPPAREITFERSDVEFGTQLTRPDPKLLEQKYVAIVRLKHPPRLVFPPYPQEMLVTFEMLEQNSLLPYKEIQRLGLLQSLGGVNLIAGGPARGYGGLGSNEVMKASLANFIGATPQDRLPSDDQLAFFSSPEVDRGYMGVGAGGDDKQGYYTQVHLLAPSQELAETRAKTLLQLLDQGGARTIQTTLFKVREARAAEWAEASEKLRDVETQQKELLAKLADFADFTSDMLTGLRLQQLQLDVELAGAQARLATCEKLLKDLPPGVESRTKIEETKTATEIEVAGIEASRAKSSELIKLMKTKNEMSSLERKLETSRAALRTQVGRAAREIVQGDVVIKQNAPLPLVDGKVLIQPIKWTQ